MGEYCKACLRVLLCHCGHNGAQIRINMLHSRRSGSIFASKTTFSLQCFVDMQPRGGLNRER